MNRELNILEIFYLVKKKIKILVILMLIFMGLGGVISYYLNETLYESTAVLTFGVESLKETGEYNEITGEPIQETYIEFGTHSVYTESFEFYKEILNSDELLEKVITNLDLDLSKNELANSISLKNSEGSGTLELIVQLAEYDNTDEIANEIVSILEEENLRLTDLDNLKVINNASEPKKIETQNIYLNTVLAGFVGLGIGIVLIIILEYLDKTIHSDKEINEKYKLPVLGSIVQDLKDNEIKKIALRILYDKKLNAKNVISFLGTNEKSYKIVRHINEVVSIVESNSMLIDGSTFKSSDMDEDGYEKNNLSTVLEKNIPLKEAVQKENNFDILKVNNLFEQNMSVELNKMFDEIRVDYPHTFIYNNSLDQMLDTIEMTRLSDGVILFVELGQTTRDELMSSKELLEDLNIEILGVITI